MSVTAGPAVTPHRVPWSHWPPLIQTMRRTGRAREEGIEPGVAGSCNQRSCATRLDLTPCAQGWRNDVPIINPAACSLRIVQLRNRSNTEPVARFYRTCENLGRILMRRWKSNECSRSWTMIFLTIFCFASQSGFASEIPILEFRCSGEVLKKLEIYEDLATTDGRRIRSVYADDSVGSEFATQNVVEGVSVYRDRGGEIGLKHSIAGENVEFWQQGSRVPDEDYASCYQTKSNPLTRTVVIQRIEKFRCENSIVTVRIVSKTTVWVFSDYSDGSFDDEWMLRRPEGESERWITEASAGKEISDWGRSQGSGFRASHIRYFSVPERLEFWSQGGGARPVAEKYQSCTREIS